VITQPKKEEARLGAYQGAMVAKEDTESWMAFLSKVRLCAFHMSPHTAPSSSPFTFDANDTAMCTLFCSCPPPATALRVATVVR
jgi:hypothetical protein